MDKHRVVCEASLGPWVEPTLKNLAIYYASGFIRGDTLGEIVSLLVRDGTRVGPVRVVEA